MDDRSVRFTEEQQTGTVNVNARLTMQAAVWWQCAATAEQRGTAWRRECSWRA